MTQDLPPDVFINPRGETELPADLGNDPDARRRWANEHGDYVYLGRGKRESSSPETILAYEKPDGLEDGINVLYGDGHVEFQPFSSGILDAIEAQQKAATAEPTPETPKPAPPQPTTPDLPQGLVPKGPPPADQ